MPRTVKRDAFADGEADAVDCLQCGARVELEKGVVERAVCCGITYRIEVRADIVADGV